MKLTNTIRDAFIRAALNDVPSIDYEEKIRAEYTKEAVAQLPPKVRAMYDNKDTRDYVATFWTEGRWASTSAMVPGISTKFKLSDAAKTEVDRLKALSAEQKKARDDLERRAKQCAYAVSTRKALVDMLPEFEKYLPADNVAASRALPVVQNVVADFVKAGWPKGRPAPTGSTAKKKAAKAAA